MKSKRAKIWVVLLVMLSLVIAAIWIYVNTLSDIRPSYVRKHLSQKDKKLGRSLLTIVERAYGGYHNWKAKKRFTFVQIANWYSYPNKLFSGWDTNPQKFHFRGRPGNDDGVLTLLNSPNKGHKWILQRGTLFHQFQQGKTIIKGNSRKKDKIIYKNYWFQFPFRIREANVVSYAGEDRINGQTYKLLYATWGDGSPSPKWDQFVLYIHPKSHLIEWLYFTVREKAKFIAVHAKFSDFHQVDGITLPFKQEVRTGKPGSNGSRLHENTYLSVNW